MHWYLLRLVLVYHTEKMKISLCKCLLSSLRVLQLWPQEEVSQDWSVSSVRAVFVALPRVLGGCGSGGHCLGHHPSELVFCGGFGL